MNTIRACLLGLLILSCTTPQDSWKKSHQFTVFGGGYSKLQVAQTLNKNLRPFQDCYRDSVLRAGFIIPNLIVVGFLIDANQVIQEVKVLKAEKADESALTCYNNVIQNLQFPKPSVNRDTRVVAPMHVFDSYRSVSLGVDGELYVQNGGSPKLARQKSLAKCREKTFRFEAGNSCRNLLDLEPLECAVISKAASDYLISRDQSLFAAMAKARKKCQSGVCEHESVFCNRSLGSPRKNLESFIDNGIRSRQSEFARCIESVWSGKSSRNPLVFLNFDIKSKTSRINNIEIQSDTSLSPSETDCLKSVAKTVGFAGVYSLESASFSYPLLISPSFVSVAFNTQSKIVYEVSGMISKPTAKKAAMKRCSGGNQDITCDSLATLEKDECLLVARGKDLGVLSEKGNRRTKIDSLMDRCLAKDKSCKFLMKTCANQYHGLAMRVVQNVIRQNLIKLRHCYETLLKKNPKARGRLLTNFRIGATGTVENVNFRAISDGAKPFTKFQGCVKDTVAAMEFPPPIGGRFVDINYPFVFNPL
ncbi:MAG: AgmX/PglI C-terminal domain-containing protein [Pseudobacteriovorax sp.]|nr:AgmX/PglI C-terminal domain-containing protein [Pseudobacteriovorax sp.]